MSLDSSIKSFLPDGKTVFSFLCGVTTVLFCYSVLLTSSESSSCISESMLIEVVGCSTMVKSELMNDLEGTINFKNNCKAVSEFKSFSMDSPISEHIFHQGRHFGLLSLSCYKNKLCEP